MVSNWILDISIGCLLLILIGYFYRQTEIFYPMFNWWFIAFALFIAMCSNLLDRLYRQLNYDSAVFIQNDRIENDKKYSLVISFAITVMWSIPILVDLIFGSMAIFTAHLLNPNLNSDDVYLICITPAILLWIACFSKRLREILSNNINSSIYSSLEAFGIVTNTFIVEWGGHSIAKILGVASL